MAQITTADILSGLSLLGVLIMFFTMFRLNRKKIVAEINALQAEADLKNIDWYKTTIEAIKSNNSELNERVTYLEKEMSVLKRENGLMSTMLDIFRKAFGKRKNCPCVECPVDAEYLKLTTEQ